MFIQHNKIILLFILLIIAGCTQTESNISTFSQNNGLAIINFTSNFNKLRINEATNIRLLFHNYGDFDARNVTSIIYGQGLLEKYNEKNYSSSIYKDKEDFHFWTLKAPLKLSQTESTTYVLSARVYYYYNFSASSQVAFVPTDYSGGNVPLSKTNLKSPLQVNIKVRNPVRTLPQGDVSSGTLFTITISIINNGKGNVDYYRCSSLEGCNKNSYINSLSIVIPNNWTPITDLSAWNKEKINDRTKYSIFYDSLKDQYDNCNDNCDAIRKAINYLRVVRENEAKIILQFTKKEVKEVTIDSIDVNGDFGYEIDASDFTNKIPILVLGD